VPIRKDVTQGNFIIFAPRQVLESSNQRGWDGERSTHEKYKKFIYRIDR
jgi:hypothetical protein